MSDLSAEDRFDILETFYRLGAGIDQADKDLLNDVFTTDATFDFRPAARFVGIDFPVLSGKDQVVEGLFASVGQLDTVHQVSNPRFELQGNGSVVLRAIVEATHFPPGDHSRHATIKNRHTAHLVHEGAGWRIRSSVMEAASFDGEPDVLLGK